jgi:hypothetical protein
LRAVPRRKGHFTNRKDALIGEATRSVAAMAVGLTQKRVVEPVTISGTAVVGLIGYPLLQPAWVMVK